MLLNYAAFSQSSGDGFSGLNDNGRGRLSYSSATQTQPHQLITKTTRDNRGLRVKKALKSAESIENRDSDNLQSDVCDYLVERYNLSRVLMVNFFVVGLAGYFEDEQVFFDSELKPIGRASLEIEALGQLIMAHGPNNRVTNHSLMRAAKAIGMNITASITPQEAN